jgi:microcystin-dependent protein
MASVLLSPVGNGQQFFDNNGLPLAGGLIYTYQAGSSTPLTTYTTFNGTIPNSNPIILDSAGRTPQEIWFQTGYTYKLVIQTSTGITLQTLDNLYPILQNSSAAVSPFTVGMILIWSGSLGSVPAGWALCDGSNSTPDLRDRFIVGAGSTYAVGATGGSANAIVVTHTHSLTDPGHLHTTTLPDSTIGSPGGGSPTVSGYANTTYNTSTQTTGITVQNAGSSGTNANLPPYYALAYIMKT